MREGGQDTHKARFARFAVPRSLIAPEQRLVRVSLLLLPALPPGLLSCRNCQWPLALCMKSALQCFAGPLGIANLGELLQAKHGPSTVGIGGSSCLRQRIYCAHMPELAHYRFSCKHHRQHPPTPLITCTLGETYATCKVHRITSHLLGSHHAPAVGILQGFM